MIIKHVNGNETDTSKISDVDAELIEKIEELRLLHAKYGRQLVCISEVKNNMFFFNLGDINKILENKEEHIKKNNEIWSRICWFVYNFSGKELYVKKVDKSEADNNV